MRAGKCEVWVFEGSWCDILWDRQRRFTLARCIGRLGNTKGEVDPLLNSNVVPSLDPEAMAQFIEGVAEFNAGHFFECHETLEDVWHGVRGPTRDFFQGLIQVAVGFYHLDNRNLAGSRSQLEKGLRKLERYGDSFMGFDLGRFRLEVAAWLQKVVEGEEIRCHIWDLPKLRPALEPNPGK